MTAKDLTSAEISNLMNSYLTNTMTQWVTRYFLNVNKDVEIDAILSYAEEIAIEEVEKSKQFLKGANYPLPDEFGEGDVNLTAPPISTDEFILILKYTLVQDAQVVYSLSLSSSSRADIRQFYENCLVHSAKLCNQLADSIIKKGLHHPQLFVPKPERIENVSKQSFLGGWITGKRPLNVIEISQLEMNFKAVELHKEMYSIFSQMTPSQELKEHFQRGVEILKKHLDTFQDYLSENDLPKLPTWESELKEVTISPFSDRLMLYKMSLLSSAGAGRYGTAIAVIMRKDLGTDFLRLKMELLKYGEDSANLMIKNNYLPQFPLAKDKSEVPTSV